MTDSSNIFNNVSDFLQKALRDGAEQRNHPFHLFQIATVCKNSCPHIRTVVNRGLQKNNRIISFHTDIRSPKIVQIKNNNNVHLIFYDRSHKIQLSIPAKAHIHHLNKIASEKWNQSKEMSKLCYMKESGPSTTVANSDSIFPKHIDMYNLSDEQDKHGKENFAVVFCHFSEINLLKLKHSGHLRANITWDKDNNQKIQWQMP